MAARRDIIYYWNTEGGSVDGLREFFELLRDKGVETTFANMAKIIRELPLEESVKRRLDELWAKRESSVAEFYDRAKTEKLPVTHAQIKKYVLEAPDRDSGRFLVPKRTGKSFANEPWSEWKVDVAYMTTDSTKKIMRGSYDRQRVRRRRACLVGAAGACLDTPAHHVDGSRN